jgi:Sugar transport protein.
MNLFMLFFAVAAFTVNNVAVRIFQLHIGRSERDTHLFQGLFCLIAAISYLAVSGFTYDLSSKSLVFSLLFGIFFASASLFTAVCFACGPMSVTGVITNASVIIPVLYGCIALREAITPWQIAGCVLLAATFIISATNTDDNSKNKKANLRWLILVFIAFLSNGITAVLQKEYKLSAPDSGGNMFMAVAYFTAAVTFFVIYAAPRRGIVKSSVKLGHGALYALLTLTAGLGSFIGNGIMLTLSVKMPASILYPFINGGLCIVISVISCLFFREKLTKQKAAAIAVGLCAVVALNL